MNVVPREHTRDDNAENFSAFYQSRRQNSCAFLPVGIYIVTTHCLTVLSERFIGPRLLPVEAPPPICNPPLPCPLKQHTASTHDISGIAYTFVGTAFSDLSDIGIDFLAKKQSRCAREAIKAAVGTALYTGAELAALTFFGLQLPALTSAVATGCALYTTKRVAQAFYT